MGLKGEAGSPGLWVRDESEALRHYDKYIHYLLSNVQGGLHTSFPVIHLHP